MGRIAYLSRRGQIWWFRRRHPVIVIQTPKIGHETGLCSPKRISVQAKGHLAVSLGTTSVREARLLSTSLSADFERAWALVERSMSSMDSDEDFIDTMAMTITEGFRKHIKILRAGGAGGLNPRVREKAYAILEADLRGALGLSAQTHAPVAANTAAEAGDTDESVDIHLPRQVYYVGSEWDDATPEILERLAELAMREPEEADCYTDQQSFDEHIVEVFQMGTWDFRATMTKYLEACERLGRDPVATTPYFKMAIDEVLETARSTGLLSAPQAVAPVQAERQVAKNKGPAPIFTDFAKSYLDLRCQGYNLRRDDEAPHAATGVAFERTSLRNWQSSVRIFSEIVGDFPLDRYSKDEILAFNAMVPRLPSNFGKSSRDTRTARQVIEDFDETEEQAIADLVADLRAKGKPPC